MTMTGMSLFTCGGLADLGMTQAGVRMVGGIEIDPDIAAHASRHLGHRVEACDILTADPAAYDRVDCLHASPPCTNASVAKTGGSETELDKDLARAVCRFLRHHRPRIFTLENVYGYRKFYSALLIEHTLLELGYGVEAWHLNAANFGVPQTRKRLIMVAIRGAERGITPPRQTNAKVAGFFTESWNGWYGAVEDLLPECPDSRLAAWQLRRMPPDLKTMLVGAGGFRGEVVQAEPGEPSFTVTANRNQQNQIRAVLAMSGNANLTDDRPLLTDDQPANTVSGAGGGRAFPKAVLVSSHSIAGLEPATKDGRAPHPTVRVVQMTPRALCRFQSIPDWYGLPSSRREACTIIGNGVPPLLMMKLYQHIL